MAAEERRRAARTIEVFLQKDRGIDIKKTYRQKSSSSKNAPGPLEVALRTKDTPHGGDKAKRIDGSAKIARRGRVLLKVLQAHRKQTGKDFVPSAESLASDGALLTGDDPAPLDEVRLEGELAGEEGEEGEEGGEEEGEEEEEEHLVA